jgi:Protein of unknown function with HXXEE motif
MVGLARYWVTTAMLLSGALTAVAVMFGRDWPLPLLLIFLHSPVYMLHQVEEHNGDRFRTFINQRMFGGVEALTVADVLRLNIGGVWGGNLAALAAAYVAGPGLGLAAPYLMLVNAISHIAATVRVKGYNPGLLTSAMLFLPLSMTTLYVVPASSAQHLLGLGLAIGFHIAIIWHTVWRANRARKTA